MPRATDPIKKCIADLVATQLTTIDAEDAGVRYVPFGKMDNGVIGYPEIVRINDLQVQVRVRVKQRGEQGTVNVRYFLISVKEML